MLEGMRALDGQLAALLFLTTACGGASGGQASPVADDTLIPASRFDDADTLVHATWKGGALVDLRGNEWAKVGSPGVVPPVGGLPEGTSNLDGLNHWELGTGGSDVLDIGGFVGCVVLAPTANDLATTTMVFSNGGSSGYELVANELGLISWINANRGIRTDNPLAAGVPNLVCFGADPSVAYGYLKVNRRAMLGPAAWGVIVPEPTVNMKIGTHWESLLGFEGKIYEIWISRKSSVLYPGASWGTGGVEALFTSIQESVSAKVGDLP